MNALTHFAGKAKLTQFVSGRGTSILFVDDERTSLSDASTLISFLKTASGRPQPIGAADNAPPGALFVARPPTAQHSYSHLPAANSSRLTLCLRTLIDPATALILGEWTKFSVTEGRDVRRYGKETLTSSVIRLDTEVRLQRCVFQTLGRQPPPRDDDDQRASGAPDADDLVSPLCLTPLLPSPVRRARRAATQRPLPIPI